MNGFILSTMGDDKLAILKFAAIASLVIACIEASASYAEKYLTTSGSEAAAQAEQQSLSTAS